MTGDKIALPITIEEMVNGYETASVYITEAYRILDEAKEILARTFGSSDYVYPFSVLPDSRYGNPTNQVLKEIRVGVWETIINKLQIRQFLTEKRSSQITKKIEKDEMGPITVERMYQVLEDLRNLTDEISKEVIKEAYGFLKMGCRLGNDYDARRTLKTNIKNARFDIGRKVVLEKIESHSYDRYPHSDWEIVYGTGVEKIRVIDKAFHLLDGKLFEKSYVSPLIDALNVKGKNNLEPVAETEYFRARGYRNGNLHLEFLRIDLLNRMNAICGDSAQLKG